MTNHETIFLQIAPLIKSIEIKGNLATIYAHHDIDKINRHNNSLSLLKNLHTIRDLLKTVIIPASDPENSVIAFKYEGKNKAILDALIKTKKRFEAIETLRKNGGLSLSACETLFFDPNTRQALIDTMQKTR